MSVEARCMTCGYDLRGNTSSRCPECATPMGLCFPVHDAEEFHRARAALENAGLLPRFVNPGGSLGTVGIAYGVTQPTGFLWVDITRLDEVEAILDELGIASPISALPIVATSDPACPACGKAIPLDTERFCPACHQPFQWVEIDESEFEG